MSGFYLLPRGWQKLSIFGNPKRDPFCKRAAWVWLIEHAAFSPMTMMIEGQIAELARGDLSYTIRHLGDEWGWPTTKVADFVRDLCEICLIRTKKVGKRLVITISNYGDFADFDALKNSAARTKLGQNSDKNAAGNKEYNPSPSGEGTTSARARRLPADFVMPLEWIEDGAAAREKANLPPVDLATEAIKFTNHFLTKAGKDGTKLDWHRAWINWCLNARGNGYGSHGNGRSHQHALDILRDAAIAHDEWESDSGCPQAPH